MAAGSLSDDTYARRRERNRRNYPRDPQKIVRREQREDRQRGKLKFRGACGREDQCCPRRWLAREAATRGGIVLDLLARRQDKGRQDEVRRRVVEGVTLRILFGVAFFNVCRTWQTYFGGYAVGPSLDFLRKLSLCSVLLVGNGGDAQLGNHFQLQVNRSENPATTTNKGPGK